MPCQYVACTFREGDARSYTYTNTGEPVAVGDVVRVPDKSGDGWKKVFVVNVTNEAPPYDCKPILGLYVEGVHGDAEKQAAGAELPL